MNAPMNNETLINGEFPIFADEDIKSQENCICI